ncbi:hypothetical protein pb186bvf_015369 [Paramecium bursaria]
MSADSKKNRQILIQQVDEFLTNNPTQIEQETSNLLSILSRFHDTGSPLRDASKSKEKKLSTINSIGSDDQQIQFLGKYKSSMIKFIEQFNYQELQVKDMIERIKTFYIRQINEIDDLIKHIFETQRSKQLQNQVTKRDDHEIQRIQYKFKLAEINFLRNLFSQQRIEIEPEYIQKAFQYNTNQEKTIR